MFHLFVLCRHENILCFPETNFFIYVTKGRKLKKKMEKKFKFDETKENLMIKKRKFNKMVKNLLIQFFFSLKFMQLCFCFQWFLLTVGFNLMKIIFFLFQIIFSQIKKI